jgi:chromate transporter
LKKSDYKALWMLFITFFKASTFTFAGALAMLPLIERDIVDKYKLISREDFLEYSTLSQTLPGAVSLNLSVFLGRRIAGVSGMIIAGIGDTISAFILMLLATMLLQVVPQQGVVAGAFRGIRAASAGLVLSAAFSLGRHNLKSTFSVIIMLCALILVVFAKVGAPIVVLTAGIVGYAYQQIITKPKQPEEVQQ